MGNLRDFEKGRLAGLEMALRIIDNGGRAELVKEIKARGAYNIRTPKTLSELEKASWEVTKSIKCRTIDTVLAMSLHTLQDEFGFGHKRLERFSNRFGEKTKCMENGYMTWDDVLNTISEEAKLYLNIRDLETSQ